MAFCPVDNAKPVTIVAADPVFKHLIALMVLFLNNGTEPAATLQSNPTAAPPTVVILVLLVDKLVMILLVTVGFPLTEAFKKIP